jgi:hypothetical protein
MRRFNVVLIGFFAIVACAAIMQADVHVDAFFTADNITAAFYQDGAAPLPIAIDGNLSEWREAKSASFDLPSLATPHTYQLIFRVQNTESENLLYGDVWNAAGFLADLKLSGDNPPASEILSAGGTGNGWQWALDTGVPSNFNSLNWTYAKAWAYAPYENGTSAKNGGDNVWGYINGGPVYPISTDAEWIWGSKNGTQLGTHGNPDPQNFLWMRTMVTVQPVPEPSVIAMLLTVVFGGLLWRRRNPRRN